MRQLSTWITAGANENWSFNLVNFYKCITIIFIHFIEPVLWQFHTCILCILIPLIPHNLLSPPVYQPNILPTNQFSTAISSCFILWLTDFNQGYLRDDHWNLADWPVSTGLKTMTACPNPSISNKQLSREERGPTGSCPIPDWLLTGYLVQAQVPWDHVCNDCIIPIG